MRVLAKKIRSATNNPTLGYIEPILIYNESEERFKQVDLSEFPNEGEIFIVKGYNMIDEDFDNGELFDVENIKPNGTSYDRERSGSCFYTATNNDVSENLKWTYIPIYDGKLDVDNRNASNIPNLKKGTAFFIRNENYIVGPLISDIITLSAISSEYFEFDDDDNQEEDIIDGFLLDKQDFIFQYEIEKINELISGNYLSNLTKLFQQPPNEVIYFGTKEKLFEWGKKTFSSKLSNDEKKVLDKIRDIVTIPNITSPTEQQKINLFKRHLGETNNWLNIELPKYFENYLVSEAGNKHISEYLEDNRLSLFNKYRHDEIVEIDNDITQKSEKLEDLNYRILEAESRLSNKEDEIFEGIDEVDKKKLKKIISDESSRTLLLKYYEENQNIEAVKTELTKLEGTKEYLNSEIQKKESKLTTLEKAIKNVKSEIFDEKEFAKKVIDAKIYTDLLNNIDPSNNDSFKEKSLIHKELSINKSEFSTKQFVEELRSRMEKKNRKISFNDLANYLVLLNQNFLIVIAGLPGVGKTSLVEKIANVIGSVSNDRYLKISVARGWTSSKDLIGYFNPLTKRYQSSKTELYEFLKKCENDYNKALEVPSIVLLDEANLSPIEHYWSEFLSLSDFDYSRSIKTTENESISFGHGVRFVATINYDHTTEILSDRLLSRAPIVKLNTLDYNLEEYMGDDLDTSDTFSMAQFNSYLNKSGNKDYFKGDVKNKFDSIIKALQDDDNKLGQPIIIGMRKYKAVERYCSVAGNIMEDSNKFIALDYAVNQYILPLINGRGDGYAKRLNDLNERLQGLPLSLNAVNRIIQIGNDNFKNFNFFS